MILRSQEFLYLFFEICRILSTLNSLISLFLRKYFSCAFLFWLTNIWWRDVRGFALPSMARQTLQTWHWARIAEFLLQQKISSSIIWMPSEIIVAKTSIMINYDTSSLWGPWSLWSSSWLEDLISFNTITERVLHGHCHWWQSSHSCHPWQGWRIFTHKKPRQKVASPVHPCAPWLQHIQGKKVDLIPGDGNLLDGLFKSVTVQGIKHVLNSWGLLVSSWFSFLECNLNHVFWGI